MRLSQNDWARVNTIFASTENCADAKVHLAVDVRTHPILEPIVLLQEFYLMVNNLAVELGFDPDSPVNLKKLQKRFSL